MFLLAKCLQQRGARRDGCFRRLAQVWILFHCVFLLEQNAGRVYFATMFVKSQWFPGSAAVHLT